MESNQQEPATCDNNHHDKPFRARNRMTGDVASRATTLLKRVQPQTEPVARLQTALTRAKRRLREEVCKRQRLESEIAGIIEREQRRLGQELHDGLGQQLTGIVYQLSALHGELAARAPDLAETARRLGNLIQDSVEQTRRLAKEFYPVTLDRDGLVPAVTELAQHTQQAFGVRCV